MENADALDLSKENIQPLKRGRNTAQLGLALQAQSDTSLHQMLSKKQEWYEMQIRSYEGSDPLELWCEYISWVEQSFPKKGPEGNLSVLLTKCFQTFKDVERYKNDPRFVGLWIKYIEMQSDAKRVELYQLLHSQGIGLRCSEFYRAWAYEFESVGDWKQADQVYKKGTGFMAQPADDLNAAYQQFLASYVFAHKNSNSDVPNDEAVGNVQNDHRLPMAALKPVGKKSSAPNLRVGSNVRSQLPGVVAAVQGPSGRSATSSHTFGMRGNNAGPVSIYQQHSDLESEVTHHQAVSSALPIPQSLNKENIIKAGQWTSQGLGSRKQSTIIASHSFAPKQPAFEVHRDDDGGSASGNDTRPQGLVTPAVLKPRKALEDGFHTAIAIFEDPNPFSKAMYRKTEVYAGGKEFQLEELHALDYFRKRAEKKRKMCEMAIQGEKVDSTSFFQMPMNSHSNNSASTSQPNIQGPHHSEHYLSRGSQQIFRGDSQVSSGEIHEHRHCETPGSPSVSSGSSISGYHPQLIPPVVYGHDSSTTPYHQDLQLGHKCPQSNQSMHNQSMTLHTKLAVHEVNNLWESSPSTSRAQSGTVSPALSSNMYQPAFQIMRDDSLSQQENENLPYHNALPEMHSRNNFQKMTVQGSSQLSSISGCGQTAPNERLKVPLNAPSETFASPIPLFEDPLTVTSYMKQHNGFQLPVYADEPHAPVNAPVQKEKFQIFCDDESTKAVQTCFSNSDRDSSPAYSSGSMHIIAKEKENLLKFPQAEIELMDEYEAAPSPEGSPAFTQKNHHNPFEISPGAHVSSIPSHSSDIARHQAQQTSNPAPAQPTDTSHPNPGFSYCSVQPDHAVCYNNVQASSLMPLGAMQQATAAYNGATPNPAFDHQKSPQRGSKPNQYGQEPMDDDLSVVSASNLREKMSESGVTEAFFLPKMSASATTSTPFQASPKKSRPSKTTIDFNSSLYRVEQSWPEEDEDGANSSSGTPKTVPPLKLFRIKHEDEEQQHHFQQRPQQLSAIIESSKERLHGVSAIASSRNSISAATNIHCGTNDHRHTMASQPYLKEISEASEAPCLLSSLQDEQGQDYSSDRAQISELSARLAKGDINPFDSRLLEQFLSHLGFPLHHHADGYFLVSGTVPAKRNNCLNLNGDIFSIDKVLGEGAYAKVLKGMNTSTQQEVALKIQKPGCRWEYYICREIQHRLKHQNLALAFMPADRIYVYSNGSVIVTDLLPFGNLLNLVNKVVATTKRPMSEPQALYLLDQLISAVAALHDCKIIHGDLKPDNILLRAIPSPHKICIQLIDFGRSIDMTLMPEGTTFNQVVLTDTFTCIEMRTGRPWTYQTDLFGLANTAHCLIFGDYMKVQESRSTGRWTIQSRLPRNVNSDFWCTFFDSLLNIESCDALPDLETLRADLQVSLNSAQLTLAISALGQILCSR